MSVKVEIKMDERSMSDFMIYRIYTSAAGMIALVLGLLNIGLTIAFVMRKEYLYMCIFLLFAVLILVVFPYFIRRKVRSQMKMSKRLNAPVAYEFMDDGVITTTADDSGKASWGKFKKAISIKKIVVLFDAQKRAIILPVDQFTEQYTEVMDLIFKNMPAPAVRIRRLDVKKPGVKKEEAEKTQEEEKEKEEEK